MSRPGVAAAQSVAAAQPGPALLKTAPYPVLSIAIAAWANATGADNLIAKAFTGAPRLMIGPGALAKPQVLGLYIGLSLNGAFASGLLFQLWVMA